MDEKITVSGCFKNPETNNPFTFIREKSPLQFPIPTGVRLCTWIGTKMLGASKPYFKEFSTNSINSPTGTKYGVTFSAVKSNKSA